MSELKVLHWSKYRDKMQRLEPQEVGCYSLDSRRQFLDDSSQLKYVRNLDLREVPIDLNVGYETCIDKEYGQNENHVLRWIEKHGEEMGKHFFDPESETIKLDFVCFRGLLAKICSTIYTKHDEWTIYATKLHSVIYLCEHRTDSWVEQELGQGMERQIYWGRKFEHILTHGSEAEAPEPLNPNPEFCLVLKGELRSNLHRHVLLYGAEVDGMDARCINTIPGSTSHYVELKSSKNSHRKLGRYKLWKWWTQSYIAGIPRILNGIHDEDGKLMEIEDVNVSTLQRMVHKSKLYPENAFVFLCNFLQFVKECVKKDHPQTVYKFDWKDSSNSAITCVELRSTAENQVLDKTFLTHMWANFER